MKKTLIVSIISALVCVSVVSGITYATRNNSTVKEVSINSDEAKKIMLENISIDKEVVQQEPTYQQQVPNIQNTTNIQNNQSSYIGEARAKEIMMQRLPQGGRFISFHLDYDDGIAEYEGEYILGEYEYEITVNAISGAIIEFDYESIYD